MPWNTLNSPPRILNVVFISGASHRWHTLIGEYNGGIVLNLSGVGYYRPQWP